MAQVLYTGQDSFTSDDAGHEHRQSLHPCHPLALAGIACDFQLQLLTAPDWIFCLFHVKHSSILVRADLASGHIKIVGAGFYDLLIGVVKHNG